MIYLVRVGIGRLRMTNGRRIIECKHTHTISTITAGLERVVCENCGHVSVNFIEATVHIFPGADEVTVPGLSSEPAPKVERRRGCGWCESVVEFMTPSGLACAEHAWKEASNQQVMGSEPWIPIRIDQRTKAR